MKQRTMSYPSTWSHTMGELRDTFTKWGVGDDEWEVTSKAALTSRHATKELTNDERRVSLWFVEPSSKRRVDLALVWQPTAKDNLRVLYLAVEAMRMNDRRGLTETIQSAYLQLEAPVSERDPYERLGVRSDAPLAVAEASFRTLAREAHPDKHGGDDAQMRELNAAIERVRADQGAAA